MGGRLRVIFPGKVGSLFNTIHYGKVSFGGGGGLVVLAGGGHIAIMKLKGRKGRTLILSALDIPRRRRGFSVL